MQDVSLLIRVQSVSLARCAAHERGAILITSLNAWLGASVFGLGRLAYIAFDIVTLPIDNSNDLIDNEPHPEYIDEGADRERQEHHDQQTHFVPG